MEFKEKLRLGIFINNEDIPLWIYRTIEKILNSEFSEIRLIIINDEITKTSRITKYSFVHNLHEKLDYFFSKKRIDYYKIVPIQSLFENVQRILITPKSDEPVEKNSLHIISDNIQLYNLDIIINLSSCNKYSSLSKFAKYGIWSCNFNNRSNESLLNGYWGLVNKTKTDVTVEISKGYHEKEEIIFRTSLANYSNSLHLNRDQSFGLASMIIPRLIKNLWLNGPGYLHRLRMKYEKNQEKEKRGVSRPPSSFEALKNLCTIINRIFNGKIISYNGSHWFLLYRISTKPDPFPLNLKTFNVIRPPKDRFWADPFIVSKENRFYVFVEELPYNANKGHIAVLELDEKGEMLQAIKVLERPYHLSYPFIFEWDSTYYMIPETSKNNTIDLYKCIQFPDKWEFQMNLMQNIFAKDTTLFYYQNKWWLFTGINESKYSPDYIELFLFYSDDLLSSIWTPHPDNPIVTNIETARPAGRIFMNDNKIFRPSQDCLGIYGRAINLNQIVTLTETDYDEILVSKIEADWEPKLRGTHTLSFDENITIIDAY